MQAKSPEQIRNLAIVGHSDTGKTTLVSALLYTSGAVNRLNKIEDGNTVTDFDPQEIERGGSISLAVCFAPWKDKKVSLFDCPGSGIFCTHLEARNSWPIPAWSLFLSENGWLDRPVVQCRLLRKTNPISASQIHGAHTLQRQRCRNQHTIIGVFPA